MLEQYQYKFGTLTQNTDNPPRRFTIENFEIKMKNGEEITRKWLVYSTSADAAYCFACRIFGKNKIALSTNGFRAWKHIGEHLRSHERSREHVDNMENWRQLVARLKLNTTLYLSLLLLGKGVLLP